MADQDVVEIVRDTPGQPADRLEFLRLTELPLQRFVLPPRLRVAELAFDPQE